MMKKIVLVCLAVLMALSLSNAVLAAGGFVSSPSKTGAPELVGAKNEKDDCVAIISVTSYADRKSLPAEDLEKFEYAYNTIIGRTGDPGFAELLAGIAVEYDMNVEDLAVSDFFDISRSDCPGHENHGKFDIVLKAQALENFVCLVHYYDGAWRIVDGAKVTQDGTYLEFKEGEFSPFAIIVNIGNRVPQSNDEFPWWAIIATVATGGAGYGTYAFIQWRKKKKALLDALNTPPEE